MAMAWYIGSDCPTLLDMPARGKSFGLATNQKTLGKGASVKQQINRCGVGTPF